MTRSTVLSVLGTALVSIGGMGVQNHFPLNLIPSVIGGGMIGIALLLARDAG